MTFLAPMWLAAAAVVGVGVMIAHLFATSIPPQDMLPTVRFVPPREHTTVLRTRRLTDIGLLLLRLLAVALLGFALAGPILRREAPRQVVLVDRSRAVASISDVVERARAVVKPGDVVIAFDSIPRVISGDSLTALARSRSRGSLSAALVGAQRALGDASVGREGAQLTIVSPLVREEIDSATTALMAMWEGPLRMMQVGAATADSISSWEIRAPVDDPVAAALAAGFRRGARVRVVRSLPTSRDSAWARDSAGALVVWPSADEATVFAVRTPADTQGGIATEKVALVAPFARAFRPENGRVLIRWLDGEPAATERPLGAGCVRDVAIPVDAVGDVALRDNFRRITQDLVAPCGGSRDFRAGGLPPVLPRRAAAASVAIANPGRLPTWLAALALVVLAVEQLLRARRRST